VQFPPIRILQPQPPRPTPFLDLIYFPKCVFPTFSIKGTCKHAGDFLFFFTLQDEVKQKYDVSKIDRVYYNKGL